MAQLYEMAYRAAFRSAFAKDGECPTCNDKGFELHEVELKRFLLECDMGMTGVSIRPVNPDEYWRVPVIEGFIEYLSKRTTVSQVEYGIDVTCIIAHMAKVAVDVDVNIANFLPKAIFTEEWIGFVAPYCPSIIYFAD